MPWNEHSPRDEVPHRIAEALLEGREKTPHRVERHAGRVRILECINGYQPDHCSRGDPRGFDDHGPAHRVADQDDAFQSQAIDDRRNILAERGKRPVIAIQTRISMSGEIESHYSMDLGEVIELPLPVPTVTRPAVHEDHRDRSLTGHLITD
jgi:hypothetical protein